MDRPFWSEGEVAGGTPLDYARLRDEELIQRLFYRDRGAFETVYDRYGDLVYSNALRVLADTQLAEDVTQEVFLRLWRAPERYVAQRGRFLSWLLSVSRNRAIDELRKRNRRLRLEAPTSPDEGREIPSADAVDPPRAAQLAEERQLIRDAMRELPWEQRLVLELAYFRGLTQQQIADGLGQPLGTVKTRVRLGMQKLRLRLRDSLGQSDS